jgi:hypothetical protein
MGHITRVMQRTTVFRQAGKLVALAASTGAALVTVVSALYSYGVIGKAESHQSIGNIGAAWVGLRPQVDTATAIGDTVHFAATIADKNGSILVGARPTWTTGDTNVARVLNDGSVIARGPGATTVSVVVGTLVAHSRVLVRPRVAVVQMANLTGDSGIVLAEGAATQLHALGLDSRGHAVAGVSAAWQVDDSTVATLDSSGVLMGHNAGRTVVTAKIEGLTARAGVSVATTAATLAAVAGAEQRALSGNSLPQAVVVRATNRRGAPAAKQLVTFKPADGQGTVDPVSVLTDADGRARTTWTLGAYPGRQTLFASVEKLDSAVAIVAEADPVAINTRVTAVSERLSGRAGEQLADSAAVRVTDSTGHVLADVPVRWVAVDGGAAEAIAVRTDSLGMARARWTLARKTGVQRLRAEVGGSGGHSIAPVTITALAAAGAPAAVVVVGGDAQRGIAGAGLTRAIVLRIVDAAGNGVADAPVVLSPSGGTVPDSLLRTDSLGSVRVRWTMGHSARDYALAVHVDGVKTLLKVMAHAVPAAPANLAFEDAPASHSRAHSKARRLSVLVTDEYGNPVPDAKVRFSTKSGVVTPARAVSDAKGRVALSWTPSTKPGEHTLTGAVASTDAKGSYVIQVGGPEAAPKLASLRGKRND